METDNPIRILFVEDVPADAEIAARELQKGGIQFTSARVDTKEEFLKALEEFQPDIIISDYAMPEFDGMQALKLAKEYAATIPFIVLTGSMNEETAVTCMKAGATDYVIKDRIVRLPFAVQEALELMKDKKEKKAARQALRESEERYRTLVENATQAIFVAQDGKLVFLNPMMTRMSGYSSEELMAKPFIEFIHPDDREMVLDRHLKRLKGKEVPYIYPYRIIDRDGNIHWVELNAVLINWNEKTAVLGFLSDITQRKKAEAEIQKRVKELEDFYDIAVGRELRMKDLKEQMEGLKKELEKYKKP